MTLTEFTKRYPEAIEHRPRHTWEPKWPLGTRFWLQDDPDVVLFVVQPDRDNKIFGPRDASYAHMCTKLEPLAPPLVREAHNIFGGVA